MEWLTGCVIKARTLRVYIGEKFQIGRLTMLSGLNKVTNVAKKALIP